MPYSAPLIMSSIRPTIRTFFVDKEEVGVSVCSNVYKFGMNTSLSNLDFLYT